MDEFSPINAVFQYKSGKLKKIIDLNTELNSKFGRVGGWTSEVIKTSGNSMYIKHSIMSCTTGCTYLRNIYTYKSGTLKRSGNTYKFLGVLKSTYTSGKHTYVKTTKVCTNKSLIVYTSTGCSKKAFTVPAGKTVVLTKCYCKGDTMSIQIKYNGKYGWFKAATNYNSGVFRDIVYAG